MASYIPTKESLMATWMVNFSSLCTATPSAYGIMASDSVAIANVVNPFVTALGLASNPATKTQATVEDKNIKKATMLVVVRQYAKTIKNNNGVSNEAKVALGLRINDTTPTPTPPPTTNPVLELQAATPLRQVLRYHDRTTPDSRARPAGTKGMVLMVIVSATPPSGPEDARYKGLVTHQPYNVSFNSADKGKTAYYFGAWYNAHGEQGPWSPEAAMVVA